MKSLSNQQQDTSITPVAMIKLEKEETRTISIYDVHNRCRKNCILFIVCCLGFLASFDEVVYLPALLEMVKDYKSTKTLGLLTISIYLLTMSLSSLVWGVLADYYGRKPMVISGLSAFILSSVGCYLSPNIYILLTFRALQGCFISVAVVVGQGTIADIYQQNHRGSPYGIFYAFYFSAGLLGPTLGGMVSQHLGWKSTFILVTIMSLILFITYILFVPETQQYAVVCKYQAQPNIVLLELEKVSKPTLTNPCLPLVYLIDSTIIPYVFVLAISYIAVNCSALLVPTELAESPYFFQPSKIGVLFIPIAAAFLIGSVVGGKLSDIVTMKLFQTWQILESRMIPGLIFSLLISFGLIIYGWAFQYGAYVSIPILGQMLAGFGQAASRPGVISYFTVRYQERAASIIAANTFVQQLSTAIILTFTVQIVQIIHEGIFFTALAVCNLLTTVIAAFIIARKVISFMNPENKLLL